MNKVKFILKSGKWFNAQMSDKEFLKLINTLDKLFPPKTIILDDIGLIYTKSIEAVLKEN